MRGAEKGRGVRVRVRVRVGVGVRGGLRDYFVKRVRGGLG